MLLVVDANVLIDYVKIDSSILSLAAQHLGDIHVPSVILDEVCQLNEADCEQLGLIVIEEPLEILSAAAENRGRLSFEDHVCLLLAQKEGWICVSNDKPLHRACSEEKIEVFWGLRLMLELVERNFLDKQTATTTALQIHMTNPRHITLEIIETFNKKLSAL